MSLNTSINLKLAATLLSSLDLLAVNAPLSYGKSYSFMDGAGANQANQVFADTRTIAASGNEDLDLAGVLTNPLGATITFTKIKAIIIAADAGNANDVVVGGAASNQFFTPFNAATDKVKVKPGGLFMLAAPDANGYGVTAGTADLLRITNGGAGTSVTYSIIIVGVQ